MWRRDIPLPPGLAQGVPHVEDGCDTSGVVQPKPVGRECTGTVSPHLGHGAAARERVVPARLGGG